MTPLPDAMSTERLLLRRWQPDDEPALSSAIAASLDHLRPWMPWAAGEPLPSADRVRWIEGVNDEWTRGGDVVFGIFLGGAPIGGTGLHRRAGPDMLEIGYWLHVDHTGHGYATEVAGALTDLAWTVPGIEYVAIHHDRANAPSRGVPERLGYAFVGEIPDAVTAPGEDGVDCCWRIGRAEWRDRPR
jgi:ribosomal-protein-serine acetyltransferase